MDDAINTSTDSVFRKLWISAPLAPHQTLDSLRSIGSGCSELTVGVGYADQSETRARSHSWWRRLSNAVSSDDPDERATNSLWHTVRNRLRRPSSEVSRNSEMSMLLDFTTPQDSQHNASRTDVTQAADPQSAAAALETRAAQHQNDIASVVHWAEIFCCFPRINTITFCVEGDSGWPGNTDIEFILGILRPALETGTLSLLQRVRFHPIHAMGIMMMRWRGFGAMTRAPMAAYKLWQNISSLDLQLHNPMSKLTETQTLLFYELLHDYLSSFAPNIKRLRFIWLDAAGPSPLALEHESVLSSTHSAIPWTHLEELWLGNVSGMDYTMRTAIPRNASKVHSLKSLLPGYADRPEVFEDHRYWLEIVLAGNTQQHSSEQWFDVVNMDEYVRYSITESSRASGGFSNSSAMLG